MITFDKDYSIELCGGIHVEHTGQIGHFMITSESAVGTGVRRIEAVTGYRAEQHIQKEMAQLDDIKQLVKSPNLVDAVKGLQDENAKLRKQIESLAAGQVNQLKSQLQQNVVTVGGINYIGALVDLQDGDHVKNLSFGLKREVDNLFLVLGAVVKGKPHLSIMISDALVESQGLNAGHIIRDIAKEIQGGGGGQPFYATAGGKNTAGLQNAIDKAKAYLLELELK